MTHWYDRQNCGDSWYERQNCGDNLTWQAWYERRLSESVYLKLGENNVAEEVVYDPMPVVEEHTTIYTFGKKIFIDKADANAFAQAANLYLAYLDSLLLSGRGAKSDIKTIRNQIAAGTFDPASKSVPLDFVLKYTASLGK